MHAITVPQDPETLRKKTIEIAKIYLAAGIDPKKSSIFVQSQVSEHAELMWILNTIARNSDLTKMTQFKDKTGVDFDNLEDALVFAQKDRDDKSEELIKAIKKIDSLRAESIAAQAAFETARHFFQIMKEKFNTSGVGLFDYPVLMAADILLYDTQTVPVGQDQIQHIELTRTLARRFNKKFGDTFIVPEYFVKEEGRMILALDNPMKKMSKSTESEYSRIGLLDDADSIRKKIKKAVTDSGSEIVYSDEKPALKNLINIYSSFSSKSPQEIQEMYKGKGYGDFKNDLAEVIIAFLEPFQKRYNELSDKDVIKILEKGASKVRIIAKKKLEEVKAKVGFVL
ncbi:MAG: hypothetical protein ACD_5C00319G0001 [uncultured bacterium]|nr:MAG: hypothetical protein ACD_5C00319G0001 [uncultured bacterium]